MKEGGNHEGAVDKSFLEQHIRIVDANYILCEKNWTRTRSGTGSYGRQVADEIQVNLETFTITVYCTVYRKIRLLALFNQGTASLQ